VANSGQTDQQVKFVAHGAGGSFFLTGQGAVFSLSQAVVRMTLVDADAHASVEGLEILPGKSNFFIGKDSKKWRTDVANYGKIRYRDAWPGIDVVYYGNRRQVEYDFVVKPGADPDRISLRFQGADRIEIDGEGELVLHTHDGEIRQHKPVIYQQLDGVRKPIHGGYELLGQDRVRFQLAKYDRTHPLVIDPTLVYSTFLGGSVVDIVNAIAVDSSGAAYVTGWTQSGNYPVVGGSTVSTAQGVIFVSKLNSAGTALLYSTEIDGSDYASGKGAGIAVDSFGNAYVTGDTTSTNFPTVNAMQATSGGGDDAFIFKLNPSGNALIYSTYVGGSGWDAGKGIAIDPSGNAYVTAFTQSTNVPTSPGAYQGSSSNTNASTFVTKVNSTGGRVYTTYLDPSAYGDVQGNAIAADASGNAYVTGVVNVTGEPGGPTFPATSGAYQTVAGGNDDSFVIKLNPTGTALVYATYLGGTGYETGAGIAVDASGAAYVAGRTSSGNFPGPISGTALAGRTDAFIVKLNAAGSALVYGRYLGGSHNDDAKAVAIDAAGYAYVTGATSSQDFPVANALQTAPAGLGGPIFKSSSAGSAWNEASSGIPSPVSQIVINPQNPSMLYAVSYPDTSAPNTAPGAIYKSLDAGATWSNSGFANFSPFGLLIDPVNPLNLYQIAARGIFKSTTAGASWFQANNGIPIDQNGQIIGQLYSFAIDAVNPSILYVSDYSGAVYVTSNGGANWSRSTSGLATSSFPAASLSTDPFSARVVYAIVSGAGVFKSTDAGGTWTWVYSDSSTGLGRLKLVSPGTGYLYGSVNVPLIKMTNGGSAWSYANFNSAEVMALTSDPSNPNNVYIGTTAGLYATTDGGNTWGRPSPTLASTFVSDLAIDPAHPANVYAVVFENIVPYVAKVNPAGNGLVYSTYLAGNSASYLAYQAGGVGIGTDGSGNAYVTGASVPSFPTLNLSLQSNQFGSTNLFIAKIGDATPSCDPLFTLHNFDYGLGGTDFDFLKVILPSGCAWTASSDSSWVAITSATSGVGTSQVYYSVSPNISPAFRSARITVSTGALASFSIGQAGEFCSSGPTAIAVGQTLNGTLTTSSCFAGFRNSSSYTNEYVFTGSAGQQISIGLNSTAFDAFLYLQDPNGNITTNADGGGGTNSRIPSGSSYLTLPANGSYIIAVTSQSAGGLGAYTLSLTLAGAGLVINPSPVTFNIPFGTGVVSQLVNITYNGSPVAINGISSTLPTGQSWLQTAAGSGTGVMAVTANASGLSAGPYTGTVFVTTPLGTVSFQVNLNVGSSGVGLNATPSALTFNGLYGSGTALQNVNVTFNGSIVTITSVSSTTTTGQNWLQPSISGIAGSVTVGINSFALSPGGYTGIVIINTVAGTIAVPVNITVSVGSTGMRFVPVTPCRVFDTRLAPGPFGGPSMQAGSQRGILIPAGNCGIPANAAAYSLNVTVVPAGPLAFLTLWPSGLAKPLVSTLNSFDGRIKANAAIVPAGGDGGVSIYVTDPTDVVLDIDGYFVPATGANNLAFYPVTPCRIADTRSLPGPFGGPSMGAGQTRSFAILSAFCGIPATAQAYALNMTVVPSGALSFLTTWPAGQSQPFVSTLNSLTGSVTANAAIVPAGSNGAINVYVTNQTDVIIDINGYFAPPGGVGELLFYPANPCRVLDTRNSVGGLGGPSMTARQTRDYLIANGSCGLPPTAKAYSLNATVVPSAALAFLTLWPTGQSQPFVSTLNSFDASVVANAALVPAGLGGAVSAYVTNATDLILDINGIFAP
jgi:hypothetical protein